ncbi:pantetheine-phosphate adenylyltransferase [Candidatus Ichthyocystis hellenicum]|uniref:pantetheine-phosphate adenylyltransferase n=1 Tax=Candidatus Ichthyocystis hellenicum TaxID=1561003 RepID=UPI000AAC278B|nr:pantetheine-phosphate adenylyltransferase [Candidatus Ichthyocystis hellenicum]
MGTNSKVSGTASENRAVYPGTFDPFTYGHEDIVKRALQLFGNITVAVATQSTVKKTLFTLHERMDMVHKVTGKYHNVAVVEFDGLLVDFMKQSGFNVSLRGLRIASDFAYEFQMTRINKLLHGNHETLFLMPSEQSQFTSSTAVREISAAGGDVTQFVDPYVAEKLRQKMDLDGKEK